MSHNDGHEMQHAIIYPVFDGGMMVIVEDTGQTMAKHWFGAGKNDFNLCYMPAHYKQLAAHYCAHLSELSLKPMPIGSRFD